jgi:restriction endonuclease
MSLSQKIKDKLLPYQVEHTESLIHILKKNITALDSSETGTGKTYCAIAVCSALNLKPIIICPKSIISIWTKVCDYFKVKPQAIINYESIRVGKSYDNKNNRIKCPYLTYVPKNTGDKNVYY